MGMLWYPGQDVDFIRRLELLEREVKANRRTTPISADALSVEEENHDLRIRIDDLEEMVIDLSETIADLEQRLS